jgi:hypothetical protein
MAKPEADAAHQEWLKGALARMEEMFAASERKWAREAEEKAAKERQAREARKPRGEVLPLRLPKREAVVLEFPPKLSEADLARRQAVIDECWARTVAWRAELDREARGSCHVGPGDPDWRGRGRR